MQDLRNIPRFRSQTVMAIKAPPEAKLHVPHPSDGLQIYMSSENGEIEVSQLHLPHPSDGLQIYMSSENGEIEVSQLHVPHPSDGLQIYMSSENREIVVSKLRRAAPQRWSRDLHVQ